MHRAGIGRQLDIFSRIISIDRFDETDRSDGDQILHTDARIIKFLCNVYDQAADCARSIPVLHPFPYLLQAG